MRSTASLAIGEPWQRDISGAGPCWPSKIIR
jgi:hypothetical protein